MPFSEVERQTSYFSAPGIEAQEIIALVVPLSLPEMTGVPRPVAEGAGMVTLTMLLKEPVVFPVMALTL